MPDGFPVFNLGNVLSTAENIQTSRDARSQANALAQRNAQNQVLLQNFLAQQPGGGPAGNVNALNQLAVGAGPEVAQQALNLQQDFATKQQEDEERQTDENIRILDMLIGDPQGARKFRLLFPQKAEQTERIIIEAGGKSLDEMSNEEFQALAIDIRTQLLPGASLALLKELGETPTITRENQTAVLADGTRVPFEAREIGGQTMAQTPQGAVPIQEAFPTIQSIEPGIQRVETGVPGGFTKTTFTKFKDRVAKFNTLSRSAEELINKLQESPDAATTVGLLAGFGNRVKTESIALAKQAGLKIDSIDEGLARFGGVLDAGGLAGKAKVFRTGVLSVALQFAGVSGLGQGRALTDKDVERAIGLVTGGAVDPVIIADTLASGLQFLRFGLEESARVEGFEFGGNIQLRELDVGVPAPGQPGVIDNSDEAIRRRLGLQ